MRKLLIAATLAALPTFALGQSFNVVGPDGKPDALAPYAGPGNGIPVQNPDGSYGWVTAADLISPADDDSAVIAAAAAAQAAADAAQADIDAHVPSSMTIAADGSVTHNNGYGTTVGPIDFATQAELDAAVAAISPDDASQGFAIPDGVYDPTTSEIRWIGAVGDDGGTDDFKLTLPKDFAVSDLSGTQSDAHWGLSAGQLALEYSSSGVADPGTLTSAEGIDKSVAPRSLYSTLYNSAAQGVVAGVIGVRNANGSDGHAAPFASITGGGGAVDLSGYNGGRHLLYAPGSTNDNFNIGPGYDGQIVYLDMFGAGYVTNYTVTCVGCAFRGTFRDPATNSLLNTGSTPVFEMRHLESMVLRFEGGVWQHYGYVPLLFENGNLREERDGTLTVWGNLPINPGAYYPVTTFPNFCADNGATFICTGGLL